MTIRESALTSLQAAGCCMDRSSSSEPGYISAVKKTDPGNLQRMPCLSQLEVLSAHDQEPLELDS